MEYFRSDGVRTGLFFGATSGVITTLGLITGLNAGTQSITAVLGGILVIAVADSMSDHEHVWQATITTFLAKFVFALSFAVPLLLLPLGPAVMASICWGMLVIIVLSYLLARSQNQSPWLIIIEHTGIAMLVVVLSHFIGVWVANTFG
jgi:VIT1/CCC1 family predicted Fe2+/Mn2+ transporter